MRSSLAAYRMMSRTLSGETYMCVYTRISIYLGGVSSGWLASCSHLLDYNISLSYSNMPPQIYILNVFNRSF